ncbi:YeiH family protein [Saccharospirillum mangrovi]|uniref:YeiH family protein n=1 Tax=Saccharospirillum mangrovi TaxID=2161747 RepID=UPI000D399C74|nr:YeiH family protein [Saccharospirillum mangrovi]
MAFRLLFLATISLLLAQLPALRALGLGSLPLAIVAGMLYGNLFQPASGAAHSADQTRVLDFAQQRLLRLGIVLFGFNLTMQQVGALGWSVLLLDAVMIAVVLVVGIVLGERLFGLSREAAVLTAVGSAVCGAAAIMATEPLLKARQRDVALAVATVVLFGTLAMFSYPVLYRWTGMGADQFGVYIGSTVHEVAQAVAAGQSISDSAMRAAVVTKLVRVMLLAPVVVMLGFWLERRQAGSESRRGVAVPWFVLGFIASVGLNSVLALPDWLLIGLRGLSLFCLSLAMVALGIRTHWRTLQAAGLRPLALSALLFVMLLGGGLALNRLFYG